MTAVFTTEDELVLTAPAGRHRDRIGNVRRDAKDAGNGVIATLTIAIAGLVAAVGGVVLDTATTVTAGVWTTLTAGGIGAVLLGIEDHILPRVKRLEVEINGCHHGIGFGNSDQVLGKRDRVHLDFDGSSSVQPPPRIIVGGDRRVLGTSALRNRIEQGRHDLAHLHTTGGRPCARGRRDDGWQSQRRSLVRHTLASARFFQPMSVSSTNFLTQASVRSMRKVR